MSWLHFSKLERLRRNRELRRDTAERARKEADANVFMIANAVGEALHSAADEARTFESYFGEPMPGHVALALKLETRLWERLRDAVKNANAHAMDEHQYDAWKEAIRAYLLLVINLLHAEEEMLTSCLVQHYVEIVHAIEADEARLTI